MKQITFTLIISTVLMFHSPARAEIPPTTTSTVDIFPYRRAAIEFELAAGICEINLNACRDHRRACLDALEPCEDCQTPGWVWPAAAVGAVLLFTAGFLTAKR